MKGLKVLVLLAVLVTLVISKPSEACGTLRCDSAPASSGLCVDGQDNGCDAWCQSTFGCSRFTDKCGTCEPINKCVCRGTFLP